MLEAFSNGDLQNFRTLLVKAKRKKIELSELLKLVEEKTIRSTYVKEENVSTCPSCGKPGWGTKVCGKIKHCTCSYSEMI